MFPKTSLTFAGSPKKGCSLHIPFDGVPYLHLNTRQYNCHQGKDKNVKIKENHRAKQQAKLCSDHSQYVKIRKWSKPTKKLDCRVKFNVVKIYRFPEFKIDKDTSWKRSTTSKKIKAYLSNIYKSCIENQKKVEKKDFNIKTGELESMGQLEYVTIFPSGKLFLNYC